MNPGEAKLRSTASSREGAWPSLATESIPVEAPSGDKREDHLSTSAAQQQAPRK